MYDTMWIGHDCGAIMQRLLAYQGGVGCPSTVWGSQRVSVRNTVLTYLNPRIQRRRHQH